MNTIRTIRKICDYILYAMIMLCFIAMFGITNLNVITRYGFNHPIVISAELARYCYVAIIYLGAIFTMRENSHISLDFFVERLPKAVSFYITEAGRVLAVAFLVLYSYEAFRMTMMSINIKSTAMLIPMAIPYAPLVIGGVFMTIEQCIIIVNEWKKFRNPSSAESQEGGEAAV